MVTCPSCGSSRIRNDYKPAPFYLRIFGIRGLLCDHCNYPFRAFCPLPPKTRRPRVFMKKADEFPAAPAVDLTAIRRDPMAEKVDLKQSAPPPEQLNFGVPSSSHDSQEMRIVTDHITPVRNDLRTEITRVHVQEAKPLPNGRLADSSSAQVCPECSSRNVKRRHRNFLERTVLSITEHKAYSCRNCGASFYARSEKHQSQASIAG